MPEKEVSEEDMKNMSSEEIAELQKQNCIFCKIAKKEIPAKIVHEDSECICILDINPASEGHILVVPKEHYMILPHIPEEKLIKLFKNVKLMSNTLLKSLQVRGTSIFIANGVAAGQRAPHVLIHVIPRKEGDSLIKMPEYDMNDSQKDNLKSQLQPVLYKIFGGVNPNAHNANSSTKKDKIVDAEFTNRPQLKDTQSTEEDIDEETKLLSGIEIQSKREKHKEESKEHSNSKHVIKESKSKEDNKSKDKVSSKGSTRSRIDPKKIDLDDISKLFK